MERTLNLGILAHVDAGKTTLTERLLYAAGVIDELGSVDAGTTQTDTLELERRRGITIRSAVASFRVDDVTVNLIDTPGHPDFIAEVERVLGILDGAILVISAVEGVQPQTRVLMRALQRLRVPTILFVNKIDRRGADAQRVQEAVARRLTPATVPMGRIEQIGTRQAAVTPRDPCWEGDQSRLIDVLAAGSEPLLAAYARDERRISTRRLWRELTDQTRRALVHPVFFGSAITGAGVPELMSALPVLLPAPSRKAGESLSARIFKIERGPSGEKIAYVRMFSGTIAARERVPVAVSKKEKVSKIEVFGIDERDRHGPVHAGQIAKLWGLSSIRIGDVLGAPDGRASSGDQFAPPSLETVVVPVRAEDKARLRTALTQLAEQDPLIGIRQDDVRQEMSISLYGEVQKEVVQATLASDYGIDVTFRAARPICIERPLGTGEAVQRLHEDGNPFSATVGLRIEPGAPGSGVEFHLQVDARTVPMYLHKGLTGFTEMMADSVRRALEEGLFGWQVTDCSVTMIECVYSSWDGSPATRGPLSTANDFRNLTPLVIASALQRAGTVVCEPVDRISLEIPTHTISVVMGLLARTGAVVQSQFVHEEVTTTEAVLPTRGVHDLRLQLPGATGGEAVLESTFAGYRRVAGEPPLGRRTKPNPLNRVEYVQSLTRQPLRK